MADIEKVAVFCGASAGNHTVFKKAAHTLGRELALRKMGLVYGGGSLGLMGTVADAFIENNGIAIGVIPGFLNHVEVIHQKLAETHIVDSMHERKALMAKLADAFVALPGGLGTLDELVEIIAWAQLGIHSKPIVILNIHRYFEPLLELIRHMQKSGFVREGDSGLFRVAHDVDEVFQLIALPVENSMRPKWVDFSKA